MKIFVRKNSAAHLGKKGKKKAIKARNNQLRYTNTSTQAYGTARQGDLYERELNLNSMDQEFDTIGFQGDRILAASTADMKHEYSNSLSRSRSRSRSRSATKNSSMKV